MNEYVLCDRNHRVVSKVEIDCACGGHTSWTCRMRIGSKPCGWSHLLPARSRECVEDD